MKCKRGIGYLVNDLFLRAQLPNIKRLMGNSWLQAERKRINEKRFKKWIKRAIQILSFLS